MKPQNASALVASGMFSVFVFPILGRRPLCAHTGATADGDPVHEEP
jgi:hypothetical protein